MQWAGMIIASIGVTLVALAKNEDANQRASVRAAMFGIGAGFLFSISSLAYRAAGHAWGGDLWVGAAATLVTALSVQTLAMGAALLAFSPSTLRKVARARRASLVPGATGAIASACLFTAFALGPSAGAVKAVQLIDVVMAWGVSRRVFREPIAPRELIGGALTLIGILGVVLWQ
jgi:drug/metabolite transporter (DMT)-like permease